MLSRRTLLCGLGAGLAGTCAVRHWPRTEDGPPESAFDPGPDQVNCVFDQAPANPYAAPDLNVIAIPPLPGASAIWGATGRDARGHIWFGVSASGVRILFRTFIRVHSGIGAHCWTAATSFRNCAAAGSIARSKAR